MSHNIVLLTWEDSAKAFEAYSKLEHASLSKINAITLLKRQKTGQFKIEQQINPDQNSGLWSGGTLGLLIGILGGPFGIILGFTAGALIGGSYDINHEKEDLSILGRMSQVLDFGKNGILIDTYEDDESHLDALFSNTGATIYRWNFDEVQSEVESTVEAWQETQRIANLTLHNEKKAENHEKRKEKWQKFLEHFHSKNN